MEDNLVKVNVVAGVVIEKDGKYLLVQEKSPKSYSLWNFPAGRVEIGDSLETTAIKEAKEETGYDVELLGEIGVFHERAEAPPKHAFAAKIIGGELKYPEDEIMDAQWFSLDEIQSMKDKLRNPWVMEAIVKLLKQD